MYLKLVTSRYATVVPVQLVYGINLTLNILPLGETSILNCGGKQPCQGDLAYFIAISESCYWLRFLHVPLVHRLDVSVSLSNT